MKNAKYSRLVTSAETSIALEVDNITDSCHELEQVELIDEKENENRRVAEAEKVNTALAIDPSARGCSKHLSFLIAAIVLLLLAVLLWLSKLSYKSHFTVRNPSELSHDVIEANGTVDLPIYDVETTELKADSGALNDLAISNLQNRKSYHLGKHSKGFVHQNQDEMKTRIRNMKMLDDVRVNYCGDVESRNSNKWTQTKYGRNLNVIYHADSMLYAADQHNIFDQGKRRQNAYEKDHSPLSHNYQVQRFYCEAPHPAIPDVTISIERQGPFTSNGNDDWNAMPHMDDVANLGKRIKDQTVYVVGTMIAPVQANGKIIGYPPLHIHHAHVFPYGYSDMKKKIRNKKFPSGASHFQHHVLVQSHADTECKPDEGGTACLLHQLPAGHGYRIVKSSGLIGDYDINDVRPSSADALTFYVDIVLLWTKSKQIETTFLQVSAPPIAPMAWMTYQFPLDRHTNVVYFNYTHNDMLGAGTISNYIVHSHMSYVDSLYVFKGKNVYNAVDGYREERNASIPYLFECHDETLGKAKADILTRAAASPGAELVCEITKPSLMLHCNDHQGENCIYRDKRVDLNCQRSVRLEQGDSLIFVAFNQIRPISTSGPFSREFTDLAKLAVASPFGFGFSAHQHTAFRADFVSDKARNGRMGASVGVGDGDVKKGAYSPPSVFLYSEWPTHDKQIKTAVVQDPKDISWARTMNVYLHDEMIHECKGKNISFDASFPWEKFENII